MGHVTLEKIAYGGIGRSADSKKADIGSVIDCAGADRIAVGIKITSFVVKIILPRKEIIKTCNRAIA